jgi:hypothetical protein
VSNHLTIKQQKFIQALQMGLDGTHAAIAAGYSQRSARFTAYELQNCNKPVMSALAKVRVELSERAAYTGDKAMQEASEAIARAIINKNDNAVARLIELRAKLSGLLREKLDITLEHRPDIGNALATARARALRPMRDLPPPIDGEFQALPTSAAARAPDKKSDAPAGFADPIDFSL